MGNECVRICHSQSNRGGVYGKEAIHRQHVAKMVSLFNQADRMSETAIWHGEVEVKPVMNPQLQATHKLEQSPSLESSASFNPEHSGQHKIEIIPIKA
ncbi:hypothetical protein TNCV_2552651 [Trichonephila clavipes]|nr:hypothetical protein TNCV_2552651 [Trichonephila clavipes]